MTKPLVSLDKALVDVLSVPERDIRVLQLRVRPSELDRAAEALDQILHRYNEAREARPHREEADPGVWTWTRGGEAIAMAVLDCDQPVETVRELAGDLEALGISGRLERRDPSAVEPLPADAYVLEARIHLGEGLLEDEKLSWRTSAESYRRVLRAAVTWCVGEAGDAERAFKKGLLDPVSLEADEDPAARLYEEREDDPQLWVKAGEETRWVATKAQLSQISLIVLFSPGISSPRWQRPYAAIKDLLEACEAEIAYAFVKHGSKPELAQVGWSLWQDWPPRPGLDPRYGSLTTLILQDDHAAPDAFALQALGPGYRAGELSFPSYTAERRGRVTLLEHRDPEAWFERQFVPPGTRYEELAKIPVPKLLADARAELDPILIQAQDLNKSSRLDPDGLP